MATKKWNLVLYSQYLYLKNPKWRKSGCGVASLAMLMTMFGQKKKPNLDKMYELGLKLGAYLPKIGWTHKGLAELAKQYGFLGSRNYDWAKLEDGVALAKLKRQLKSTPVIASVFSRYQVGRKGHLVVLVSLNEDEALILDPKSRTRPRVLPAEKFIKAWKKRIIIIA